MSHRELIAFNTVVHLLWYVWLSMSMVWWRWGQVTCIT